MSAHIDAAQPPEAAASQHVRVTAYYVNGERFETPSPHMTVAEILTASDFVPVEDYRLTRDDGAKVLEPYDARENIRPNERFTVTFLGLTPTS